MTDSKKKCPTCDELYTKDNERLKGRRQCRKCRNVVRARWGRANRAVKGNYQRQWRSAHFFKHRASYLLPCTGPMLAGLWKQQRGRCALTGEKLTRETAHLDHIKPKCRGGSDEIENLQWTTESANKAKGALNQKEFLLLCKVVVSHAKEK